MLESAAKEHTTEDDAARERSASASSAASATSATSVTVPRGMSMSLHFPVSTDRERTRLDKLLAAAPTVGGAEAADAAASPPPPSIHPGHLRELRSRKHLVLLRHAAPLADSALANPDRSSVTNALTRESHEQDHCIAPRKQVMVAGSAPTAPTAAPASTVPAASSHVGFRAVAATAARLLWRYNVVRKHAHEGAALDTVSAPLAETAAATAAADVELAVLPKSDLATVDAAPAPAVPAASSAPATPAAPEAPMDPHAKVASGPKPDVQVHYDALHRPSRAELLRAWAPWILVSAGVAIWSTDPVKNGLNAATLTIPMTHLDKQTRKPDLIHGGYKVVGATWKLDLLAATGVCIFFCAFLSAAIYGTHPRKAALILFRSLRRMSLSLLTIMTLLAFGYVLKFSGMDITLGLAAAKASKGFVFLSPFIGFLGVALTGSATTSNVIFGVLQTTAADTIGQSHMQMAAANTCGGILGHIVSTSSMVVAAATTGFSGGSLGPIIKSVIAYAAGLIILFGLWNCLVAFAFPGFLPNGPYEV